MYKNPNIYQPNGNTTEYDPAPSYVIRVRCPHCQNLGTFPAATRGLGYIKEETTQSGFRNIGIFAFIRICPNPKCGGLVFTLSANGEKHIIHPPELLDFNAEALPPNLVATLKEAITCHSVGAYRASAMMVRRLLEELCDDANAMGKNLHERLKALRTQITLPDDLFSAMDELKALGNDAAHIEAKAYKVVDKEEAELSIELAQEILKARYQHKSLVDRLRARRGEAQID